MNLVDDKTFEEQGGLTIGIGAGHCLYTLRTEYWDTIGVFVGDGQKESRRIRASRHIRNLGKDWSDVAERMPEILVEMGEPDTALYVPGHCDGKLDPNKSPDAKFIPTDIIPFGDHQGQTIGEVREKNADYLFWLAENYHPSEEKARGRWMAYLRDRLAPDLNARRIAREAEQKYRQDVAAANSAHFKPLADLLAGNSRQEGDFCSSIAKDLREGTHINDVPARAAAITRDIWSKQMGGRRGSKAYEQAAAEFDSRFVAAKPEVAHAEMTSMAPLDRAKRFLVLEASLPELTKGTGLEAHEPQLLRSDMWQKDDGLGRALRELDSHRQALFGEMPFERAEGLLSTAREKLDDETVEAASSGHVAKATVHLFANQHAAAAASLTRTVTLTVPCPEPNLALVESVRPKVQAHDVAEDLFYVSANPTDPQKDRFRHCRPVGVGDAIEMLLPGRNRQFLRSASRMDGR